MDKLDREDAHRPSSHEGRCSMMRLHHGHTWRYYSMCRSPDKMPHIVWFCFYVRLRKVKSVETERWVFLGAGRRWLLNGAGVSFMNHADVLALDSGDSVWYFQFTKHTWIRGSSSLVWATQWVSGHPGLKQKTLSPEKTKIQWWTWCFGC